MAPPASPRRVSVVTGANSGIGLEVAAGLRGAGHHVVLACRSTERCAAAKAELDSRGLPGSCECRQLDLSDYTSIRRFAAGLQPGSNSSSSSSGGAPLAALVNNAGVMGAVPDHNQPNHFGPYLLTRLLLPLMAEGSRIVTVASEAHRRGSLAIKRQGGSRGSNSGDSSGRLCIGGSPPSNWYAAYAQSKLMNVLMTAELTRRLEQRHSSSGSSGVPSVTCYSVSPGRVATNIFSNVPGLLQRPLQWLAAAAFQTPAQGARTVLHAALAPELAGRHELYLHDCRAAVAAPAAREPELAAQLWELSNQEVGLTAVEDAALWPSR